jgi:hypothetical protein
MRWLRVAIPLLLAGLACNSPLPPATPSPQDVQTAMAQTQAALPSATPSAAVEVPSATSAATDTALPGPTPTPSEAAPATIAPPTPAPSDQEVILITTPGLLSRVTSPVRVAGEADPTFEQTLVVEVFGENADSVAFVPVTIGADVGQRGPFEAEIEFTVQAEQPGRISVYSESARDGGLIHLASVEVTLLPSGQAEIIPGGPHIEELAIHQPALGQFVSGGIAFVSGWSAPTFEQNLVIEVRGEDGAVVGSGPTTIQAEAGQAGSYLAEIPYTVSAEQPGRIVVYHASARDGGLLHLASVELTLAP